MYLLPLSFSPALPNASIQFLWGQQDPHFPGSMLHLDEVALGGLR
jgi:hypothetical protein